ncbi:MAG TPA: cell wall metabolism sensor histidine kinase VicK [Lactococcus sp.]|uniref:ATP-binding protein n=1 Tax=Lactococcus TaxID=1357 RepID=UPI000E887960|nr:MULTISPECIES: ATP-binding protein [Lactococcus]HBC91186.1 cell wall metabolism sensor histidine kinase VicK [Lactococcus sp.]
MNKFFNSIVLKGVVIHLLLFGIFEIMNSTYYLSDTKALLLFFIFYIVTLSLLIWYLSNLAQTANKISNQVDNFLNNNYENLQKSTENDELSTAYNKLITLGHEIEDRQEHLENQRSQLESILTYLVDGVITTDRHGHINLANHAALNLLDQSNEGILGKELIEVLKISDKYSFHDLLQKEPELTLNTVNCEGASVILRVNFMLFRSESGFISGIIAVLHDTTEQEKTERDRRLFVSNVSHELRTPLTSVKAYLEALNDGALADPNLAASFVDVSLNETDRMIRMIGELLELSRMDQDKVKLHTEIINYVDFINYILDRFDKIIEKNYRNFKIKRQIPRQEIWLEIDTDKLSQVIDNIINNAFKYSPNGGTITVTVWCNNNKAFTSIADQGIGIPKPALSKVFDRFYRVDNSSRNSQIGGTGLGLSIAYDIMKLHKGDIQVTSDGKNGSTFTLSFPYSDEINQENNDWEDFAE